MGGCGARHLQHAALEAVFSELAAGWAGQLAWVFFPQSRRDTVRCVGRTWQTESQDPNGNVFVQTALAAWASLARQELPELRSERLKGIQIGFAVNTRFVAVIYGARLLYSTWTGSFTVSERNKRDPAG